MTKIIDVEANLEQFKSETLARQEETLNRFDRMQESIDRNKVESNKQFVEMMQQYKALFSTIDDSSKGVYVSRNHRPPVSSESIFQNYPGNTFGDAGGNFANTNVQPTSTVHGSELGWKPGSDHRMRKLKMPLFDGEDVYGRVYEVERFFEVQGLITTVDRLRAAVLSLEGSALSWFRWINNREPFHGCITTRSNEESVGGSFIKGLTPELRTAVRTQQPTTLSQAMDLTMLIDETRTRGTREQRGGTVPRPVPTRGDEGGVEGDQEDEEHFYLDSVEVLTQSVVGQARDGGKSGQWDVRKVLWDLPKGEVRVNWKRLTMMFQNGDNRVTLCGEPGLHRTEASLRSLVQGISVND
nr:Ty3/gypsy retrotransposon protein [Tanacetum cinerariifolium]